MKIKYKTIVHPKINSRFITLLQINGLLDLYSARYLVFEARYGGFNDGILGITSHMQKAVKIGELFKYLDEMGLTWKTATEEDIRIIRNYMLCWDLNNNLKPNDFNIKPIKNDTMNQKLVEWFKFYKYMKFLNIDFRLNLSTFFVKRKFFFDMNYHLNYRKNISGKKEVWRLKVKKSPKKYSYNALSRIEFEHFCGHLEKEDIVFKVIALLMVETGLRIRAIMDFKYEHFKGLFKYLNTGKNLTDTIEIPYIAKGGDIKYCDLPIRTIIVIQKIYLSRIFIKRQTLHYKRSKRLKNCNYNDDVLWIKENGKEVFEFDIRKVFKKASILMGYKYRNISPHWMRHTFATWSLIDFAKSINISLNNTGNLPNPLFLTFLQQKLGHATIESTLMYIATAFKLMNVNLNNGPILMSIKTLKEDYRAQELLKEEAKLEFKDMFDEEIFDPIEYARSKGIGVDF